MEKKNGGEPSFELNILGDELEQHRIQLEHNLQHTDLSLHLSSVPDDSEPENPSIEYPRHKSGPSSFQDFVSFEYPSGAHLDQDSRSMLRAWSYHTVDDDEGIHPYVGETMSTAAHHASALTLSAGLTGRPTRRGDSFVGAEYDPERLLPRMTSGANSRRSAIEGPPKSKSSVSPSIHPCQANQSYKISLQGIASRVYNPVVDGTAQLDLVLQSGHALPPASLPVCLDSHPSSPTSPGSDTTTSSSRPRLSDALRRVSFSPKRPRNTQSHQSSIRTQPDRNPHPYPRPTLQSISPPAINHAEVDSASTKRNNVSASCVMSQPQVCLQAPTPSADSRSAKTGILASQIQAEAREPYQKPAIKNAYSTAHNRSRSSKSPIRNPFSDLVNQNTAYTTPAHTHPRAHAPRRSSIKAMRGGKTLVHLPDVTGLTSAVESPAKLIPRRHAYHSKGKLVEIDGEHSVRSCYLSSRLHTAYLLTTLNAVQSKLLHLESENSISRRRVRELEVELNTCQREVARDRVCIAERKDDTCRPLQEPNITTLTDFPKGKDPATDGESVDEKNCKSYTEILMTVLTLC